MKMNNEIFKKFYGQMKEISKKYDSTFHSLIYPESKQDILNIIRNRESVLKLYDFRIAVYDDKLNYEFGIDNVYCYIITNNDSYTLSFYAKYKLPACSYINNKFNKFAIEYKTKQKNNYKFLLFCNSEDLIENNEGIITVNSSNEFTFDINDIDKIISNQDILLDNSYKIEPITGTLGTLTKFLKISELYHKSLRPTMCFVNPDTDFISYCYLEEKDYKDVIIKLCIDDKYISIPKSDICISYKIANDYILLAISSDICMKKLKDIGIEYINGIMLCMSDNTPLLYIPKYKTEVTQFLNHFDTIKLQCMSNSDQYVEQLNVLLEYLMEEKSDNNEH